LDDVFLHLTGHGAEDADGLAEGLDGPESRDGQREKEAVR
jgi:hypothetical protein